MGKRRNKGSQRNKISRVHSAEEWRSREKHIRERLRRTMTTMKNI